VTLRIGWFTSTSDPRTVAAFGAVAEAARVGALAVDLAYVLVAPGPAEAGSVAAMAATAQQAGIPLLDTNGDPGRSPAERAGFERSLLDLLGPHPVDLGFLVGYGWIAGPVLRSALRLVNVHPAPVDGPVGREATVVEAILDEPSSAGGLTAHVVTDELDRGTPLTTTTWARPERSGRWPRRAIERADLLAAVESRLAPFCLATLAVLAEADLAAWPPEPRERWPVRLDLDRPAVSRSEG